VPENKVGDGAGGGSEDFFGGIVCIWDGWGRHKGVWIENSAEDNGAR
jgi:hypothetical protein